MSETQAPYELRQDIDRIGIVFPTRQNYELDEIERLTGEVARLENSLEAVKNRQGAFLRLRGLCHALKAEFDILYAETPPIFQARLEPLRRLFSGVE